MKVPNWLGWMAEKTVYRKRLTKLALHYERSYVDDEQIYESFVRQFFSELDEQVALLKAQVEDELGKKLGGA